MLNYCSRSSFEHMPWYQGKAVIREYLEEINKDKKVCQRLVNKDRFVNEAD